MYVLANMNTLIARYTSCMKRTELRVDKTTSQVPYKGPGRQLIRLQIDSGCPLPIFREVAQSADVG
jgi:hypothetical protein